MDDLAGAKVVKLRGDWYIQAADGSYLRGPETLEVHHDGYGVPLYGAVAVPTLGRIRWKTKRDAMAALAALQAARR